MIISAAKATEAAQVLGVNLEGLTPTMLSRAYRTLAKDCHPDHHGSSQIDLWAKVSWAKECLVRWLEANEGLAQTAPEQSKGSCRACGGAGRIKLSSSGFGAGLTKICVMCGGSGDVVPGTAHYGRSE